MTVGGAERRARTWDNWRCAALVGGIVFTAALFGIMTRQVGLLAATWPANALLLGLFLRNPHLATRAGWMGAIVGFIAADMVTGSGILITLWLSSCNLAGVATGFILARRLRIDDQHLRRPLSVLYLFAVCACASIAASLVGFGATPLLFNRDLLTGFGFWFASELVNYVVVLPAVLTAPRPVMSALRTLRDSLRLRRVGFARYGPILALMASVAAGEIIGGPGAIAFPMPALLWCALSYSLFSTALLTLLLSMWTMIAISTGVLAVPLSDDLMHSIISVRLGITLLALGPMTVASVNAARNELLRSLHRAVSYDSLTGTLARNAFFVRAEALLGALMRERLPVAALMIDVDSFKQVNDGHGHLAGDKVLVAVASAVGGSLRENDLFGRMGGEEFAIILPRVPRADATAIAERLRVAVENTMVTLENDEVLKVSVSVGLAYQDQVPDVSLERLLSTADRALYRAKLAGRNQVMSGDR